MNNENKLVKHLDFILLDIVVLLISYVFAFRIRHGSFELLFLDGYQQFFLLLPFFDLLVIVFFEIYSGVLRRRWPREIKASFISSVSLFGITSIYIFLSKVGDFYSRISIFLSFVIYFALSFFVKTMWKRYLNKKALNSMQNGSNHLFLMSEKEFVASVIQDIENQNYSGYKLDGVCILDEDLINNVINEVNVVCNKQDCLDYIVDKWIDEVLIVAKNFNDYTGIIESLKEMGITISLRTEYDFFKNSENNISVKNIGPYMVTTYSVRNVTFRQIVLKRIIDIIGGSIGCIATLFVALIIGPMIYVKSPGPIIYSSTRIGQNGKRFKFYKFRSMVLNADELKEQLQNQNVVSDGMMFKIENDPRIIPGIGNFIRKTSLDEFPQFWNVLKGEMSLVGTRPPTVDEWNKYKYHHRFRLAIKPGITGLWQISGRSNITDFEEVIKLDEFYVNHWDVSLDLDIILKTVIVVLLKKGSM